MIEDNRPIRRRFDFSLMGVGGLLSTCAATRRSGAAPCVAVGHLEVVLIGRTIQPLLANRFGLIACLSQQLRRFCRQIFINDPILYLQLSYLTLLLPLLVHFNYGYSNPNQHSSPGGARLALPLLAAAELGFSVRCLNDREGIIFAGRTRSQG